MKYIECPREYKKITDDEIALFLAGGITGCSDWQNILKEALRTENVTLLNPRRKDFDINNKNINMEQISWEYDHLARCDATSFWFTKETVCPITLYELGKQSMINKPLFVGVHPEYSRREDLKIQLGLVRPEIEIAYDLNTLASHIKTWIHEKDSKKNNNIYK